MAQRTDDIASAVNRSERLGFRFRRQELAVLTEAARLEGVRVSEFVRSVVLDAAQRRLARARRHAKRDGAKRGN